MLIWNGTEYAHFWVPNTPVAPEQAKRNMRAWVNARNETITAYAALIDRAKARFAADPRWPGAAFAVAPPPLTMPDWAKE